MQDPFKMALPAHLHMSVESGSILSGVSEPNISQIPPIKQMIYQLPAVAHFQTSQKQDSGPKIVKLVDDTTKNQINQHDEITDSFGSSFDDGDGGLAAQVPNSSNPQNQSYVHAASFGVQQNSQPTSDLFSYTGRRNYKRFQAANQDEEEKDYSLNQGISRDSFDGVTKIQH